MEAAGTPTSADTAGIGAARDGGNGAGPRRHDDHDMDDIAGTAMTEQPTRDGEGVVDDAGDESAQPDEPDEQASKSKRRLRSAIEWVFVIGGALVVALVIRTFLLQAFWIPTASMEETLQEGDRVLVNKLSYDLHDVNRGDIIVFERPPNGSDGHPEDDIKDLIKRVVALPGETIEARDGVVYIDGRLLDEPYLADDMPTNELPPTEVPEGHVFVMGDNRTNSSDSRVFGPIDEDLIVGRAWLRIWPLGDFGGL
jgi:signal peptidase I